MPSAPPKRDTRSASFAAFCASSTGMAPVAALAWYDATMLWADCTAVVSSSRRDSMIWERCCSNELTAMNSRAIRAVASISKTLPLKLSAFTG